MNGEIAKLIYNQELEMKNGLLVLQSCVFDEALTIEESRRIRNFGPYRFLMHWKTIHPETGFFSQGPNLRHKKQQQQQQHGENIAKLVDTWRMGSQDLDTWLITMVIGFVP